MSVRRISMSAGQRFLSTVSQSSSNPRNSLSDRPDRAFGIEIFGSAPMRFSGRIVVQGHAALRLRTERFYENTGPRRSANRQPIINNRNEHRISLNIRYVSVFSVPRRRFLVGSNRETIGIDFLEYLESNLQIYFRRRRASKY